ncbi:hypothetical protein GE061_019611 [Apolygus lucorum]|uniref:Ubiquinone biosynthesis O-methyltransferase, mitochondrial n=1 Tax=Apolygus lucorum TaxID=248454 RepID=A0A8S9XA33_APOLU|nr:hypothetical protein GE061_019611 [Apolygus lucorum]
MFVVALHLRDLKLSCEVALVLTICKFTSSPSGQQSFNSKIMTNLGLLVRRSFLLTTRALHKNTTYNAVDKKEVEHFTKLGDEWLNPNGPMRPLFAMNNLRIPFLRNGLINTKRISEETAKSPKYLRGVKILDVGCGGGILSLPLARLGADVTGLDPTPKLIEIAQANAEKNLPGGTLRFECGTIEDHSAANHEQYDAIICSEVIEHVSAKDSFINSCVLATKPGGSLVFTTISQSTISWLFAIVLAEYVFRLLPTGTHEYDKLITSKDLSCYLEKANCNVLMINGMIQVINILYSYVRTYWTDVGWNQGETVSDGGYLGSDSGGPEMIPSHTYEDFSGLDACLQPSPTSELIFPLICYSLEQASSLPLAAQSFSSRSLVHVRILFFKYIFSHFKFEMGIRGVILSVELSRTALLVVIFSACFVHFSASSNTTELQLTSQTKVSKENSTDSTAQESTVNHYKKVRNNVIRYGAIYRGNSSIRTTRAFTRRPKASRKDKHRHSTKVDTTKLPIVLLPPVLTFKKSENVEIEKYDPFVINVVSSELPLTTSPSDVTNPYSPEYENIPRQSNDPQNVRTQAGSNRPYVDEKIMAMKNFGIRMQGRSRGDVRFQSTLSPRSEGTTLALNDYTPPPTFFPTVQKLRQVGKQSHRRRTRVRTTTIHPYVITEVSTEQTLPRENHYDNSLSQKLIENSSTPPTQNGFDSRYNTDSSDFLGGPVDSTSPAYSDFTNSSLADVLNYDIQRTSPRPIFSLDATGPITSVGDNRSPTHPPPNDSRFDANTPDVRYEGSDFLNNDPVSSPGSPTTHLDEYFSNVYEVSSSQAPRTEINVATSTSQFVESPTPKTEDEEVFELKDLIYPPINILAPPFLEDVFHDQLGNVILNATEPPENAHQVEVTTSPYLEVSANNYSDFIENNVPSKVGEWIASTPPAQSTPQPYRENYEDNSIESATERNDRRAHQVSSQYTDCENGDCLKNETATRPWTSVPFSPSDVKVLSDTDGLALINRMYENLLRVLNGGPDYYDLSEEPQKEEVIKQTESGRKETVESSNLLAEESGDIRNARQRGRSQNSLVPTGQRTSRRKEIYNKGIEKSHDSEENQELKRARADRKASQLCNSKTLSYVADVSSGCKVFYVCTEYGVGEPMLCPNGTLFNQDYLVCDWWYNVECS